MLSSDKIKSVFRTFFIISLIFCTTFFANAQKWEIGAAAGGGNYIGEVNPTFRFENYRPAGGIFGRYNFSQVVSAKLGLNLIKTHGSNSYYKTINPFIEKENFIRVIGELAGQIEYNFFNYRDELSRRNWTPYYFIGVGAMYMHGPTGPALAFQPVVPTGIGLRIIKGQWNLGLELGARKTFTDYFDHISENPDKFRTGNKSDKDWYFLSTISLSYTFYSIACPFKYD